MNKRVFLIVAVLLVIMLQFVSADVIERGADWNKISNPDGSYNLEIYNNIINLNNGSAYLPADTTIRSSNYSNFAYELTSIPYKVYFRNNSNTDQPVRFEKDGYFLVYDISEGQMRWRAQPGFPDRTDTLGGGYSSNSLDSYIVINDNIGLYPGAFSNTNVTYGLTSTMLKEHFILSGLPSFKDYLYLEYTGRIYFNKTLKICANSQCYVPSGTDDDFNTTGKIEFKDDNNITLFYLTEPIVRDSNGSYTNAIYFVKGSNAQMGFDLRINKSFLETAVFPVYIDPSIKIDGGGGGGDAYVDKSAPNRNYGESEDLKVQRVAWQRAYLKFNISSIPDNQVIDNATLCLYLYNDQADQNISINHVYNNSWCEGDGGTDGSPACEITWNNQPCGTEDESLNSSFCNETAESKILTTSDLDNTWQCKPVKNMVNKEYNSNNESISIVLWTIDTGSADIFYSKEYTDSSFWPYLNITYHLADAIAPSLTINSPLATSYSSSQILINFSASDSGGISKLWYYNETSNVSYTSPNYINISYGIHTFIFYANDSAGNLNYTSVTFFVDSVPPGISFSSPTTLSGNYYNLNSIFVNVSVTDENQVYSFINFNNSLLVFYKMNESSGSLIDSSGYIQNAVNQNSNALYNQPGIFGKSIGFSEDSWFKLGKDDITFTDNNFTISFWINPKRFPVGGWTPLAKGTVASYSTPFVFYGISAGHLRFYTANALCTGWELDGNAQSFYTPATLNQWQLITVTKAGSSYYLYKNAVFVKNVNTSSDAICSNSAGYNMTIGGTRTGAQLINGTMDEILIFNRALSNGEIFAMYNSSSYSKNFTGLGEGNYSFYAYSQDTAGNENITETRSVVLEIGLAPSINIISPLNQSYNKIQTELNYSVSDSGSGIGSCWYSLNNGLINSTSGACNNFTGLNSGQGSSTWRLYSNDSLGNENSASVTFFVDSIAPGISIVSPSNRLNSTDAILEINYLVSDSGTGLDSCWWTGDNGITNNTIDCGSNITGQIWFQGTNTIIIYTNDSLNNINYSSVNFFIDNIAPIINIFSPESEHTYGYNTSLSLNFSVSDSGIGVYGCWYSLDVGENITLTNCQNITFNVTGEGSHTIVVYANDSLGNENSASSLFSIVTTAPVLNLIFPKLSFLNYTNNIYLNYSVVSGLTISQCELWGNWTGSWEKNQTNSNIIGENNFFIINLTEGSYKWGIYCNDSQNRWSSVNSSFYVDTTNPQISITQPTGTKTSRTGIPLTFSIIDSSPVFCWYNVKWTTGENVLSNTTIANCSSTSFNLAADGDYTLNLYANDSAGNLNSTSSSFSVSTSTTPPVNPPSDNGGGGGGGGALLKPKNETEFSISITTLDEIIMRTGESKTLSLEVRNTGKLMQNNCKIVSSGWIISSAEKDMNANEKADFVFILKIPKDSEIKDYQIPVTLKCQDGEKTTNLKVSVIGGTFDISIKEIKDILKNKIRFDYSISELSGFDKTIEVKFSILDSEGNKVVEDSEFVTLKANEVKELSKEMDIPDGVVGESVLIIEASSEGISIGDQRELLIGGGGLTGFASFFSSEENKKITSIIVIILVAGLLGFFVLKRILKTHKQFNEHKGVIKISKK